MDIEVTVKILERIGKILFSAYLNVKDMKESLEKNKDATKEELLKMIDESMKSIPSWDEIEKKES